MRKIKLSVLAIMALSMLMMSGCFPNPEDCCVGDECDPGCEVCETCEDCKDCPDCPGCPDPECPDCPNCPECPDCPDCPDCPECPECPDCPEPCGCVGGVIELTLQYKGTSPTEAKIKDHWGRVLFRDWLDPEETFTITGLHNHNMLGPRILLYVDCQAKCHDPCTYNAEIHTSCSQPIGPGLRAGDFLVVAGLDTYSTDLCDYVAD